MCFELKIKKRLNESAQMPKLPRNQDVSYPKVATHPSFCVLLSASVLTLLLALSPIIWQQSTRHLDNIEAFAMKLANV